MGGRFFRVSLRNSIITDFNERNPQDQIQHQDNYIFGAGFKAYKAYNKLKDFKSWYAEYLTDSGVEKNEAKNLANQKLFYLVAKNLANQKLFDLVAKNLANQKLFDLKKPKSLQEELERDELITDLASKSDSLSVYFSEIYSGSKKQLSEDSSLVSFHEKLTFFHEGINEFASEKDQKSLADEIKSSSELINKITAEIKDQNTTEEQKQKLADQEKELLNKKNELEKQKVLADVMKLSPEELYELTTKIIDNSKVKKVTKVKDGQKTEVEVKSNVTTLQALSLVDVLRKARIDIDIKKKAAGNQSNHAPATTTNHKSVEQIANSEQNMGRVFRF